MGKLALNSDTVFKILRFLNDHGLAETARRLEKESGLYLNLEYVRSCVNTGRWDEVAEYLSGFVPLPPDDSELTSKLFMKIFQQKILESTKKDENFENLREQILLDLKTVFHNKLTLRASYDHNLPLSQTEKVPFDLNAFPEEEHTLPLNLKFVLQEVSRVVTMDFHPRDHKILIVGMLNGSIALWDVTVQQKLYNKSFENWDCKEAFPNFTASVNRVKWSPGGSYVGVAFSNGLVHVYSYRERHIEAYSQVASHQGNVFDIAFYVVDEALYFATCGDDKCFQMWQVISKGLVANRYGYNILNGFGYSLCCWEKQDTMNISVIDASGTLHFWMFDEIEKKWHVNGGFQHHELPCPNFKSVETPCHVRMLSMGMRRFLGGTNGEGISYIMEWDGVDTVHEYHGIKLHTEEVVQFDINNKILAAGDDYQIKFWDVDSTALADMTFRDARLPCRPCVRFNKEGSLLAVSTREESILVLANAADGPPKVN